MMSALSIRRLVGNVLIATVVCSGAAVAQTPEQFYKGKTITIYIGYGAGGGYDFYGRLFARYIRRHIPGQPNVVPANMPGAGSLVAANYLYNIAPNDGTALGVVSQGLALEDAFASPNVKYRAAQFQWIGRMSASVEMTMAWHTAKVKTIQDAYTTEIVIGGDGPGSTAEFMPKMLNKVIGTKFKVISGYSGANEIILAMERGELEAATVGWSTITRTKRAWIKNKQINPLVQLAPYRAKDVPDVPNMVELGKTDEQKSILSVYASGAEIGRAIFGSPKMPADRVQALRDAFIAMTKDPEFLAEVQKTETEFDPLPGGELQKVVESAVNISPDIRDAARRARE
jgi:tripartite-type tricarboxylate transporter receptor subunit TctC